MSDARRQAIEPGNVLAQPSYVDVRALIGCGQWKEAVALAGRLGREALVQRNFIQARNTGALLERLNDHRAAAHLLSAGLRGLQEPLSLPEWDGSDLSGRTLVVVSRNMHVGPVIRYGRLLARASEAAKRCIALVEARLLPLFRRSFPDVDVREAGRDDDKAFAEADVAAGYETLVEFLGVDGKGGIVPLRPLKPDANRVAAFRANYCCGRPAIGICWYSTNANKDLPSLPDWGDFLRGANAIAVSLQYGEVAGDLDTLQRISAAHVLHDETVDSLHDLDGFAAQIAALDAVVTISNTGAHMAGALGVPMLVLLDDKDHLMWPFVGRTSDWYPSATLYRKGGRPWREVFMEVSADLRRADARGNEI